MAVVADRTVTESIDELVREAESLKTRLEEERSKFNDMERTCRAICCLSANFAFFFLVSRSRFASDDRGRETRGSTSLLHEITTYSEGTCGQSARLGLVERQAAHGQYVAGWKAHRLGCVHDQQGGA